MNLEQLFEAPISDFQVSDNPYKYRGGDLSSQDQTSFRTSDLNAIHNKKWVEKVHNMFSKCPYDFNLYIFNGNHAYRNLRHSSGMISKEKFKNDFDITPPNAQNAINVCMTNNEGDERFPLTPWMVAHRVVHALLVSSSPEGSRILEIFSGFVNFMKLTEYNEKRNEIIASLSNFKSARDKKIARIGEYLIDLITNYIVTGTIHFNKPDLGEVVTGLINSPYYPVYLDGTRID